MLEVLQESRRRGTRTGMHIDQDIGELLISEASIEKVVSVRQRSTRECGRGIMLII